MFDPFFYLPCWQPPLHKPDMASVLCPHNGHVVRLKCLVTGYAWPRLEGVVLRVDGQNRDFDFVYLAPEHGVIVVLLHVFVAKVFGGEGTVELLHCLTVQHRVWVKVPFGSSTVRELVWSLTQFYYIGFLQSRTSEKVFVFL